MVAHDPVPPSLNDYPIMIPYSVYSYSIRNLKYNSNAVGTIHINHLSLGKRSQGNPRGPSRTIRAIGAY